MKHSPNFETGKCHNCGKKLTPTNFIEGCKMSNKENDLLNEQREENKTMHTPTPWRYQSQISDNLNDQDEAFREFPIFTATGKYGHPATCLKEEDANFIVTACNAYEDLLEACKDALSDMVQAGEETFPATQQALRDAIAKANVSHE